MAAGFGVRWRRAWANRENGARRCARDICNIQKTVWGWARDTRGRFFAALRACDFIAKPAVFSLNLTLKTVSI